MTDPDAIASVIRRSTVCRLAMSDDNQPYVIPMSFGYRD
ncbi:MAG: pyridoxamine 5'-phosphate oxidase family protein, partial [Deltaproteobacteria bacterium]|nr:pyridoxamine 5'-phosphate oxidase family protein [Deltaproteobacteria bacterium]